MLKPGPGWNERQVGIIIGDLLRTGVITAASLVLSGGVLYLFRHGPGFPDYKIFRGEPQDLRSIPFIIKNALDLRGRGLIQLGLLVLIITPVARVIFSVFAFFRQRDTMYVIITSIVLAALSCSLFGLK